MSSALRVCTRSGCGDQVREQVELQPGQLHLATLDHGPALVGVDGEVERVAVVGGRPARAPAARAGRVLPPPVVGRPARPPGLEAADHVGGPPDPQLLQRRRGQAGGVALRAEHDHVQVVATRAAAGRRWPGRTATPGRCARYQRRRAPRPPRPAGPPAGCRRAPHRPGRPACAPRVEPEQPGPGRGEQVDHRQRRRWRSPVGPVALERDDLRPAVVVEHVVPHGVQRGRVDVQADRRLGAVVGHVVHVVGCRTPGPGRRSRVRCTSAAGPRRARRRQGRLLDDARTAR